MTCPLCEKEIKEGEPVLPSMMSDEGYYHDECATKRLKEVFEPLAQHLSLERLRKDIAEYKAPRTLGYYKGIPIIENLDPDDPNIYALNTDKMKVLEDE